LATIA